MVRKGNLAIFEGKQNGAISPKLEKPDPPKWVCMHFTSTSTCIKILSQFYFFDPHGYSSLSKREKFEKKRKGAIKNKTRNITLHKSTKTITSTKTMSLTKTTVEMRYNHIFPMPAVHSLLLGSVITIQNAWAWIIC